MTALRVGFISLTFAALSGVTAAQTVLPPRGGEKAPDAVRAVLGAWDLQLSGASRLCTITLGAEEAPGGRQIRFPAICRRALPVLDQISSWSLSATGHPRLGDAAGKPIIAFEPTGAQKSLRGQGPDGKSYLLDAKTYSRLAQRAPVSAAEAGAQAAQRRTVVDLANSPAPESLPGRYVMMRQQNREACRFLFSPGPLTPGGNAPASFDGHCQDTGMTIFDPVGWRYASGRLTLVARKGHSVELVFENGQWRKDPAVGAPLMLRKLTP